jgi:hypothetical protein
MKMSIMVGSPSARIGTPPKPEFAWGNQAFDTRSGWGPPSMLKHTIEHGLVGLQIISEKIASEPV